MYCKKCGGEIPDNSSVCGNCKKSKLAAVTGKPVIEIVKPRKVMMAIRILCATLAISMIILYLSFSNFMSKGASLGSVIVVSIITLLLFGFIIYKINRGKNWSRIAFLVFFILGFPSIIVVFQNLGSIKGMLNLLQIILEIVALVFLFSGEANKWFKQPK